MVHREGAYHQIERVVGKGKVRDITDLERWSALVDPVRAGCVGLGLVDHGWVEVDSCYVEAGPACQLY
jgi:hypothetical protein